MSEKTPTAEGLLNNLVDSLAEKVTGRINNSGLVPAENKAEVNNQFNRFFGRQKPVHNLLGGGKSADVMLWRNKKESAGILAGATAVWILFQWLQYNFLSLICFSLVIFMVSQYLYTNVVTSKSSNKKVQRVVLSEELFVNMGKTVGVEVNRGLGFLQDVACKGTIKEFATVVGSLLSAAIVGTWFSFLNVIYLGFVAAHTLPAVYEKYDQEIDAFLNNLLAQLQSQCNKLEANAREGKTQ